MIRTVFRALVRSLPACASFFIVLAGLVGPALAQNLVPLHLWWSPSRQDNFVTTDHRWRGRTGETRSPDYEWVGVLGYAIDPAFPQPPDTVPLYSWYSPSRGDNFISSDPVWRPRSASDDGRLPDYRAVRREGYIYTQPLAGTVPLQSHWSSDHKDNHATTDYAWIGRIGKRTAPDYSLYRTEGYVVAPRAPDLKPADRDAFGIGRARFERQNGVPVVGTRPLLVIMTQYSDVPLRHSRAQIESLFFDPANGMPAYFREMSRGRFRWTKAGLAGPYTYQDDPGTPEDESTFHCAINAQYKDENGDVVRLCPEADGGWETRVLRPTIELAAQDVDFSRFDTRPRDGRVDTQELGVAYIGANPPKLKADRDTERFPVSFATSGATRSRGSYGGCFPVSGIQFCAHIASIGEGTTPANVAHELFHVLNAGVDNDIYGSGSYRASLMGGTIVGREDQPDRFHLDPWHKMRAGWAEPLIRPILSEIPPDSATLTAPSVRPWFYPTVHPILFFDPGRGTRNMVLAEYRERESFDSEVADQGVALWFARINGSLSPFSAPREVRADDGRLIWSADGKVGETLWSIGAPSQRRGGTRFWKARHGETPVRWYPTPVAGNTVTAGPESGLRLRAGTPEGSSVDIEWRFGDRPFLGRIDTIRRRTDGHLMSGNFGLRGSKVVRLEPVGGGRSYEPRITSWRATSIRFDLPTSVPAGNYYVRVYADGTHVAGGNRYPWTISTGAGPF